MLPGPGWSEDVLSTAVAVEVRSLWCSRPNGAIVEEGATAHGRGTGAAGVEGLRGSLRLHMMSVDVVDVQVTALHETSHVIVIVAAHFD